MKRFRNDIILVVVILVLSLAFYFIYRAFNSSNELVCKIYQDQELKYEIALDHSEEIIIDIDDDKIIIEIDKTGVYVKESSCEDKICVNQGKITRGGQIITCLPNKVYIKLEGKGADVYL
jgi:hypothetical protein